MAAPPRLRPEPEPNELQAAWAFLWILFAFKMITVGLIFWHMRTFEAAMLLTATTWFWLLLAAVAVAGPLLFRYRLVRVRAKRERLRRAEWLLDPEPEKTKVGRR